MTVELENIANIAEVLLPLHMFEGLFGRYRRSYTALAYYVALILAVYLIPVLWLRVAVMLAVSLVGNYVTYRTRPLPCIFITALYYSLMVLSHVLCGAALKAAGYTADIAAFGSGRGAYLVSAKLLNLFLVEASLMILGRGRSRVLPLISLPLMFCQALSIFACWRGYSALEEGADSQSVLLMALCLLLVNILICLYARILEGYYEKRTAADAAGELAELQRQYFDSLSARQEETRALWHDIKKYVSAMETMVNSDKTDEARECFREIREKYEVFSAGVDLGNSVVNSILGDAVRRAGEAGIDLRLDVWVAPELDIPPADLYIIIGNTLDNAFDACRRLEPGRRTVELLLRQSNHLLYYELRNPCDPAGTGRRPGVHGYGLRNARACVERNRGSMDVTTGGGEFTVSVQLNV